MSDTPTLSRSTLEPGTVVWLDGLRFVCAEMVVLGHIFELGSGATHAASPQTLAVIGFYLLSGFLIVHTITHKMRLPGYDFTAFFIDRFCRIYPAYIGALVCIALMDVAAHSYVTPDKPLENLSLGTWLANIVMLQKIPIPTLGDIGPLGSAAQLWSLSPEWWIYMFAGFALLSVRSEKVALWKMGVFAVFSYVPFVFLVYGNPHTGVGMTAVWLFGALAYQLYRSVPVDMNRKSNALLMGFGCAAFAFCTYRRYAITDYGYDILAAFDMAGLFYCSLCLSRLSAFATVLQQCKSIFRFGAGYSFSLYLTHYSLNMALSHVMTPFMSFVACNLFAVAFAYIFERRYKDLAAYVHSYRSR